MNPTDQSHLAPFPLTVETRILGWGAEAISVPLPSASLRVVDLIRAKMAAEWAALQRGERAVAGRESIEPDAMGRPSAPSGDTLERLVRAATDGYRAGWYIILVNGEQPGGLDARLSLTPESAVAFVRIYPLPDAERRA